MMRCSIYSNNVHVYVHANNSTVNPEIYAKIIFAF